MGLIETRIKHFFLYFFFFFFFLPSWLCGGGNYQIVQVGSFCLQLCVAICLCCPLFLSQRFLTCSCQCIIQIICLCLFAFIIIIILLLLLLLLLLLWLLLPPNSIYYSDFFFFFLLGWVGWNYAFFLLPSYPVNSKVVVVVKMK